MKLWQYYTRLLFTNTYQSTLGSLFIDLHERPSLIFEESSRTLYSALSLLHLTLIFINTHLLQFYSISISEVAKCIKCILCFCTVHFNIIIKYKTTKYKFLVSIVKATRRTKVSSLFYFGMIFYMFRTDFPSIIRSSRMYIQQQAFVKQLASSQQYLSDKYLLLYVQSWTPDDGRKDRPKHVGCHSKIK